jgi:hypothetical protein
MSESGTKATVDEAVTPMKNRFAEIAEMSAGYPIRQRESERTSKHVSHKSSPASLRRVR